jgi:ubiquinone biosynthesis protein
VLTEERIFGVPLSHIADVRAEGYDTHTVVQRGTDAYLKMMFDLRKFHSDPHPGNLMAMPGNAIGFLDFGRVSTLSEHARDRVVEYLIALEQNDPRGVTEVVMQMSYAGPEVDRGALRRDIERMMDRYASTSMEDTIKNSVLIEMLNLIREHEMHMPSEYTMLFETLGMVEGVIFELDPGADLLEMTKPFAQRMIADKLTPEAVLQTVSEQAKQYFHLLVRIPDTVEAILDRMAVGDLGVKVALEKTDPVMDRAEIMVNRMAITLLLSAMAIAFAMVAGVPDLPSWVRSAAGVVLLLIFLTGVWLVFSIIGAERRTAARRRQERA